jgi:hypothetical protein
MELQYQEQCITRFYNRHYGPHMNVEISAQNFEKQTCFSAIGAIN